MIDTSGTESRRLAILAVFLAGAAFMLFWNLGRYALWDDETMTALAAEGVIETGDTSAMHGRNIAAYREGLLLKGLHDRSTPPLASYLAAVSLRVFGPSAWAARIPFAALGFSLMLFAAAVIWRSDPSLLSTFLWSAAILGNTSLMLFLRQCRYYSPVILLSVLIGFLYLKWEKGFSQLAALSILSFLLFAANSMNWLALSACLLVDYLFWKRKTEPIGVGQALAVIAIQGLLCGLLALIWNPLFTRFGSSVHAGSGWDRFELFYWNLRDLNAAEFMAGGLVLLAIPVAILRRDSWLMRGLAAIVVFVGVVSLVSPQTIANTRVADVRYLAPLIPVGIGVGVRLLTLLFSNAAGWAVVVALVAFWTNILNGTIIKQGMRSVPAEYLHELLTPNQEPYTPVIAWVNSHVKEGESIWVLPDHMTYPLMFHAPQAVYAWQLARSQRSDPEFKDLPPIHFKGVQSPDYLVVFGPAVVTVRSLIRNWKAAGVSYQEVGRINAFWKDLYRPELFWRTFTPILNYDPETQAIYIFKKS
ncbi:MAG: hypothetical protein NTX64_12685 [Elusimicrobia bacterium]|nr:hypothetical protein [Elusimicrobiota bacterium]